MRNGDWMQTFTGRRFYPLDPRVEDVDIHDIAHALGMLARFGGHALRFYSVGQHVCHVSDEVRFRTWHHAFREHASEEDATTALWGLMHDASEAYCCDLPRPIKRNEELRGYRVIEKRLLGVIAERFDLPFRADIEGWGIPPVVYVVDEALLATEAEQLMHGGFETYGRPEKALPLTLPAWTPERAEAEFLERFHALYTGP